jgi:hypothetical protein
MEDIGTIPPLIFSADNDNFGTSVDKNGDRLVMARYWSGLARISLPYGVYYPNANVWLNIYRCNAGAKYKMIYGGFTWPVNVALWHGAMRESNGIREHGYQWQSDSNGNLDANVVGGDPGAALRLVTSSAYAKLKADWGDNVRIYVIKYRKQDRYKHKITGNEVNFDYSYLDNSASKPSYVYDVSNEEGLKTALTTIAADIKSFAGYTPATELER